MKLWAFLQEGNSTQTILIAEEDLPLQRRRKGEVKGP